MIEIKQNKFSRILFHIILIFFMFFLQTSVFPLIPIFTCSPNFLLIITFSYGLFYGEIIGMITGIFVGFLFDMYFNGEFGLYILIYSLIGYFNGRLKVLFLNDNILLPLILCFVNGFIYNFYIYITHFLIRKKFIIFYYIINIMLPNIIFTFIFTLLIYKLLYKLNFVKR